MKNVTVTMEDEVARWVRIYAAERDTSVSKVLGELLKERMQKETGYETAMRRFLERRPRKLRKRSRPYPAREELHDRRGLR